MEDEMLWKVGREKDEIRQKRKERKGKEREGKIEAEKALETGIKAKFSDLSNGWGWWLLV